MIRIANKTVFCVFNSVKKLLREWNEATANREFVFLKTNPIPQLPNSKIKKKIKLEIVKLKFKCQTNHKIVIISIPTNFGKGDKTCCKKPRQPISSNKP